MAKLTLLRNGNLVTMNKRHDYFTGDLLIKDNRIQKIAKKIKAPAGARVVDVTNHFVIPGLIQAHTHLCQTLARGEADDMALLNWLEKKIWPMEDAHSEKTMTASAELGLLEMLGSGTTTILDMGTVKHTDVLFSAVEKSGMRYIGGKCLMDAKERSGELYEPTRQSLVELEKLIRRWHQKNELLEFALSPRFVISCTEEILRACGDLAKKNGLLFHTHASESLEEVGIIRGLTGRGNIEYLNDLGLLNSSSVIVHGVHMNDGELKMMCNAGAKLVHCPSSNLKLASGIAPIEKYRLLGLVIGVGADGAPCNNSLDPFIEMRLAALLQKPLFGCEAMSARHAFELATTGGATVLGKSDVLGSLEVGKFADVVAVRRDHPSVHTVSDPYSALVYSCLGRDVRHVWVNGKQLVRNGVNTVLDHDEVFAKATAAKKTLFKKI